MEKTKADFAGCCPLINNCPADKPTMVAGLGWRFFYTMLAYAVLGQGILPGTGFFVSLTLFTIPLFMDYIKFTPDTKFRGALKFFGMVYSGYCGLIGIFGLMGILIIGLNHNELYLGISPNYIVAKGSFCPLTYIWYSIGGVVGLTAIDWVAYRGYLEKNLTNDSPVSS